jgi:hypothetical protein
MAVFSSNSGRCSQEKYIRDPAAAKLACLIRRQLKTRQKQEFPAEHAEDAESRAGRGQWEGIKSDGLRASSQRGPVTLPASEERLTK